jgi:hypothetical protein
LTALNGIAVDPNPIGVALQCSRAAVRTLDYLMNNKITRDKARRKVSTCNSRAAVRTLDYECYNETSVR